MVDVVFGVRCELRKKLAKLDAQDRQLLQAHVTIIITSNIDYLYYAFINHDV